MFGNKLEAANNQITSLVALLAIVGYKPGTAAEANEAGFRAALEAHVNSATTAAVATATAPLNSELTALRDGLKTAGVTLPAFNATAKPEENSAAIVAAVEKRVTAKAVNTVASTGHEAPLPVANAGANASAGDEAPKTKEEFRAALKGFKDAGKRQAYFRQHSAKFGL